ncbi:hypothetical protein PANI_CDS0024 [Maribacter phage Panino]
MRKQPEIGQEIYIPSELYLGHGADDVQGGKTTITDIHESEHLPEEHTNYLFVSVEGLPSRRYNWYWLSQEQEELKAQHGDQKAKPEPDNRPEFNTGW